MRVIFFLAVALVCAACSVAGSPATSVSLSVTGTVATASWAVDAGFGHTALEAQLCADSACDTVLETQTLAADATGAAFAVGEGAMVRYTVRVRAADGPDTSYASSAPTEWPDCPAGAPVRFTDAAGAPHCVSSVWTPAAATDATVPMVKARGDPEYTEEGFGDQATDGSWIRRCSDFGDSGSWLVRINMATYATDQHYYHSVAGTEDYCTTVSSGSVTASALSQHSWSSDPATEQFVVVSPNGTPGRLIFGSTVVSPPFPNKNYYPFFGYDSRNGGCCFDNSGTWGLSGTMDVATENGAVGISNVRFSAVSDTTATVAWDETVLAAETVTSRRVRLSHRPDMGGAAVVDVGPGGTTEGTFAVQQSRGTYYAQVEVVTDGGVEPVWVPQRPAKIADVLTDASGDDFVITGEWQQHIVRAGDDPRLTYDNLLGVPEPIANVTPCDVHDGLGRDFVVRMTMGDFVDYFRPAAGVADLCEMLTSNSKHEWSPSVEDGSAFVVPTYHSGAYGGGSASFYSPVQPDRVYVSFWSGTIASEVGGCCHSTAGTTQVWGQAYVMDVAEVGAASALSPPVSNVCEPAPATPVLTTDGEDISDGLLTLSFDGALSTAYSGGALPQFRFVGGATDQCDTSPASASTGSWAQADEDSCRSVSAFTAPVAEALRDCFESGPTDDGAGSFYYEAVVEATHVTATSAVFGDGQTRTDVTSFRVRVAYPKDVSVSGNATVFGAVIDRSALTEQTFDSVTQEFGWNLATSVQYPYYLEAVEVAVSGGHAFDTVPVVASGGDCAGFGTDAAPAACTQDFALSANETDDCLVPAGTTVTVTFQILCRPQYAGSCDLPEGNTTTASFTVETDNFCPRVVEVASITPALTTYSDSGRTSVSTNYILETTLFARVTADVEAGLQAQRTTLTGLDIVSSCTGCGDDTVQPFADGLSGALADYGFQYAAGGTDNTATGGEVETDFQFTLNTNSLSFDNDATTGEAQITLTAFVSVEYDTPSAQGLQRSYRVQAVSGPGSIGSSATAQATVSSQGAAPSSTAGGSTVLGVSAGVAVAAVCCLAVVAVGSAVALGRRRRRRNPSKLAPSSSVAPPMSSSSSFELAIVPDPAAPVEGDAAAVPGTSGAVPTDDLQTVRAAYA